MNIREQIAAYEPFNEQEEKDKAVILDCLDKFDNVFTRENKLAHMTASAWVVNKSGDKALMAYHNIYNSWSWLGGHADGERDLLSVALREVKEESGISNLKPVTTDIFSLEVLTVDGHIKRGKYVSSHLHLNVTYLIEADETAALKNRDGENSAVAWFGLNEAVEASTEEWFKERIYSKLNKKFTQNKA